MDKKLIPVNITCERPKLEVGKKYELHLYDLHSYEGYSDDHECIDTLYITYQGGDIALYFMQKAKRYAESRFDVMSYLGEYEYKLVNPIDSSTHCSGFWDMVLECVSEKTLVKCSTLETIDNPSTHAAIALNIWEYKEPKFENL
jgi:hypothetical protein